ncbi:DUF1877 family protein [Phycicoccus flavus]|uniref:Uncharacterized protein n=1 Tax=Phycicoccus flavus TaxID=2502783 RepID=A0A8T6R861_9MICO|nr:DUF1877 family protein [Phycicoccus flavus]NHA68401.1 hypothetical protein [Phycicoccus flavus]
MSLGMHVAVTDDDVRVLRDLKGDEVALVELVHEEVEERDDGYGVATDKAWDPIHRSSPTVACSSTTAPTR